MTTTEATRPPQRQIRIDDCRTARIIDNPTPQCPHGKLWRTSTVALLPRQVRAAFCEVEACAASEYTPQAGHYVVLRPLRTFAERRAVNELLNNGAKGADGRLAPVLSEAECEQRIRDTLATAVIDWNWTGADGEPLPLPGSDWAAVTEGLEQAEVMWLLYAAYHGADPDEVLRLAGNA